MPLPLSVIGSLNRLVSRTRAAPDSTMVPLPDVTDNTATPLVKLACKIGCVMPAKDPPKVMENMPRLVSTTDAVPPAKPANVKYAGDNAACTAAASSVGIPMYVIGPVAKPLKDSVNWSEGGAPALFEPP